MSPQTGHEDPRLDGCFLQQGEGRIIPDGNLYRKTGVYRAAVSLTLLDYCADTIPAYAGNMRLAVGGMTDTDEEKEWLRELREWRATNLVSSSTQADAVDGSLILSPELTAVLTGRRSTTKPKEMWLCP